MAANIEHNFYTPGPWVQPNMRNIGDSLLDLYKMKLAREEAAQQREESKMNMELKRMEMSKKIEEEKRQKEYMKQVGGLANQYQKSQNLPEKVKASPAPNLAALFAGGAMPNPAGASMQGVMNRAMQGSFPQQFAAPRMGAEELQRSLAMKALEFGDPEKAAAALKLLNPTQSGRTAEEQMAIDNNRNKLKQVVMAQALEDRKAAMDYAQTLRDGTIQGEQKFRMYMAQINQGFQERMVKLQIASRPDAAPIEMEGLLYSRPAGGGYAPVMVPDVPAATGAVQPSAPPPPPMAAPGAGASMGAIPDVQSPGMQNAANAPLPADYGSGPSGATLYSGQTATGTAPLGPEPLPTSEPLPQTPTGMHQARVTPKVGQSQISEKLQSRYDRGIKVVTSVEPQFKTMFRLLDQTIAGADSSATRSEMIQVLRAKVLDPISVVREGEVFRYEGLLSLGEKGEKLLNQISAAKDFTPQQARAVKDEMAGLYQDMKMWEMTEEAYFKQQADAMGVKFVPRQSRMDAPAPTAPSLPTGAVLQRDKTGKTVGYRVGNQKFYMDGTPVSGGK